MKCERGSYSVSDDKYNELLDKYYEHVFENKQPCSLIEQHSQDKNITPIICAYRKYF